MLRSDRMVDKYSKLMEKLGWLYGAKYDEQEYADYKEEIDEILEIAKSIKSIDFVFGLSLYKKNNKEDWDGYIE